MLFVCGGGRSKSAIAAQHYVRHLTGEEHRFDPPHEPTQEIQMAGPDGVKRPVRVMVRGHFKSAAHGNFGLNPDYVQRQLKPEEAKDSDLMFFDVDPERHPGFLQDRPELRQQIIRAKKENRFYNIWEMGQPPQEEVRRIVYEAMRRHYGI